MGIKNDHKEKRNIIERIEILETQDHQSKQACPLSKKFHHVEEKIAKRRISYVYFFQKYIFEINIRITPISYIKFYDT